ncbi:hypothetical protein NE236_09630 [Actinoallomurus purpureus]|uniref:hypothetical protein n=1 Tax=Actinoallomurus purpureus TaxID=478114 RepID=UPI002093FCF5|nr:hypothetical protein [Actinoallomurus purpureus]MCO6005245.1 hypothetical protein [Actinoallomurus purpureus]
MFKRPLCFLPTSLAAGSLLAAMALSAPALASTSSARMRQTAFTALGYNSTDWKYIQVPPATSEPLFYERSFDDSGWPTGQEGFGTVGAGCSWNNPAHVKTRWAVNTDILVRHWVHIPRDAQQVRIQGTIDNDAQVYFNGHLLQTAKSGNCIGGAINAVVPANDLECGNLLAIRGHDYGLATYLNVEVTYLKPIPAA